MATFLETLGQSGGFLELFIPFIFVFAVVYGILQKTEFISSKTDVNGIISFATAFMTLLFGGAGFITSVVPLLAIFFLIVVLVALIFNFMGAEPKKIFEHKSLVLLIGIICALLVFYVFGKMYGMGAGTVGTSPNVSVNESVNKTVSEAGEGEDVLGPEVCKGPVSGELAMRCLIANPKVLGTIIILSLMAMATYLIIKVPES